MHKENRLALRKDFQRVYRFGRSIANFQFVLYINKTKELNTLRLGVSVSKKVGNAIVRNRIRRRVKEIIRLKLDQLPKGVDLILIARKPVADMDYHAINKSLIHLLKKSGLLDQKGGGAS
jgi:ribonuclease P protein component